MKKLQKLSRLALALLAGAPSVVQAQIPALPAAAAVPVAGVPVAGAPVAAAPVAAPRNLWSFLCPTEAQKANCKAKFCGSQFGQLINNTLAPASAFTGGVLGQPCPGPNGLNPNDLLLPPDSALGAAAKVKQDTLAAAARRAAIRYLSTTDCNWWPEAQAALANTLRADRNECVRLEAALALRRGCCCNKVTILALVNAVSVLPRDTNPREDSPRVRGAAMVALEHCLACYESIVPAPVVPATPAQPLPVPRKEGPPPKELPPTKTPELVPPPSAQPPLRPVSASAALRDASMEQVIQEARRVLRDAKAAQAATVQVAGTRTQSLGEVFQEAFHPGANASTVTVVPPPGSTIFGPPEKSVVSVGPPPAPAANVVNAPRPFVAPAPVQGNEPTITHTRTRFSPPPFAAPPAAPTPPPAPTPSASSSQSAHETNNDLSAVFPPPSARPAPSSQLVDRRPTPSIPSTYAISAPAPYERPVPSAHPVAEQTPEPVPVSVSAPLEPVEATPTSSSSTVSVEQLVILLHDSTYPDAREYAASSLGSRGEQTPTVVRALVSGASEDTSADVRLACLKSLMKLRVNDPGLPSAVARLQADQDPRVRDAAKAFSQWLQSQSAAPGLARPWVAN